MDAGSSRAGVFLWSPAFNSQPVCGKAVSVVGRVVC